MPTEAVPDSLFTNNLAVLSSCRLPNEVNLPITQFPPPPQAFLNKRPYFYTFGF